MKRPKWGAPGGAWSVGEGAIPERIDVRSIRLAQGSRGLTQAAFAQLYGFTPAAVQDWEQGRRQPGRATRLLLELIRREPEAVQKVLGVDGPATAT